MVMDPRKRQKKVEKRNAKQKARKKALARLNPGDIRSRLMRAAAAPILHCLVNQEIESSGMGSVLISRELASGNVAFAAFLVDMYCLGVKDAMSDVVPRGQYDFKIYEKLSSNHRLMKLKPECARKLVEGAVEYARSIGLPPHADYDRARLIFGNVDPATCTEEFEYGKNGKPLFIAGPHDTAARCRQILAGLSQHMVPGGVPDFVLGPGNLLTLGSADFDEFDIDDDDEDNAANDD